MYIAVFSVLTLIGLSVPRHATRVTLIMVLLFLLWFMGGRYEVGCDFGGYMNRFLVISPMRDLAEVFQKGEPGFELLITGVRVAGLEYMWLNVAASAIILGCYYHFLRAHHNPLMILALLFPIMILQLGMSGLRQAIAVAMLMSASVHFLRGERVLTGLWILAGAQFHTSVVLFLPIAFLAGRSVSIPRMIAGVGLLLPFAAWAMADRFEVYQDRYVDQIYGEMSSSGGLIRYIMLLVPNLFFLMYHRRLKAAFPAQYPLLKLFAVIAFAIFPVIFVSTVALHRLNYYVMPFSIVTFVYLSHVIFPRAQTLVGRLLPALFYGGYSVMWLLTSRHADLCYTPYRNYLFQ